MEFEDDVDKEFFEQLQERVKILEAKFEKLSREVKGPEDEDVNKWTISLNEMKEIKNFFENRTSDNSSFINNTLDEFKELSLYHINKEKIKYLDERDLIKGENESNKKQIEDLKNEIKKLKENKFNDNSSNNYLSPNSRSINNSNELIYDKNNFDSLQNKSNVGKLNRNNAIIYNDNNSNNYHQTTDQNPISSIDNIISKKSSNDSNTNFWNKYNYYDNPGELKNMNLKNNNSNNNPKNGNNNSNNDIDKLISSNNNKYGISSNDNEKAISSNMRKYSPYILNKKNY